MLFVVLFVLFVVCFVLFCLLFVLFVCLFCFVLFCLCLQQVGFVRFGIVQFPRSPPLDLGFRSVYTCT